MEGSESLSEDSPSRNLYEPERGQWLYVLDSWKEHHKKTKGTKRVQSTFRVTDLKSYNAT